MITSATHSKTAGRPLVWIKRLVLYKSLDPWEEIRPISFSTGLNIIQGESNEVEGEFQTGHGIGKTTVCRLIRYCFGEKTYGQKHVIAEVTSCFPDGYVGAEIELAGKTWAVLLPLGKRTRKYALEGVSLSELLLAEGAKRYEDFIDALSAATLADVPINASLTGQQTLQWQNVLAMFSRDQESRYDRYWNWRDKRSESGTSAFDKPKVDAGLCLRAILGLLDPLEPILRKKLDELEATLKNLDELVRREKELPTNQIATLRQRLETEFGVLDATTAPIDQSLFGMQASCNARQQALEDEIAQIEAKLEPLNRQINMTAASLLEPAELAEQLEATTEATADGTDSLLEQLQELQRARQILRDTETALCRYGRVLIGECSYVQSRTQNIDASLRENQRTTLPMVSEREQASARIADQARRQRSLIGQVQERLDSMGRERNDLIEKKGRLRGQLEQIPLIFRGLVDWNETVEGRRPNTAIKELEVESDGTVSSIASTKEKLEMLIIAQVERAKQFTGRFDTLVKRTLTNDYQGVVSIEEDGVNFRIVRGGSLAGEAYETLAILLADLALLFQSDAQHSHSPGFLIHDSPREADLNLAIYRRLLDMAQELMQNTSDDESLYQYIVTTTTTPSKSLQKKKYTILELGSGERSLFRRQLEVGTSQNAKTLFDGEEDA